MEKEKFLCKKCQRSLYISDFEKEPRTKRGFKLKCKECDGYSSLYVNKRKIIAHNFKNYQGQRFGWLTAVEFVGKIGGARSLRTVWRLKCDCGNVIERVIYDVVNGRTKSCGCLNLKKGRESSRWEGYGDIPLTYFTSLKSGAKSRNLVFEISIEQMWEQFEKQKKQCALSGVRLILAGENKGEQTASLDRIDSSQGYILSNIQWVHKDLNAMKMQFDEEYFLNFIKKIYEYRNL